MPITRRHVVAFGLVGVAALLLLGAVVAVRDLGDGGTASSLGVADRPAEARSDGSISPDFSLPALDGDGAISLSQFRGAVVVLNFWATWCGPCRREAPALQAAWEDYRDRGVQFLGVNHQDAREGALAYERELGITYPSVFDPAGEVALDFGLLGLPTTLVIEPGGRIAYRFTGYLQEQALRDALDELLGEGER